MRKESGRQEERKESPVWGVKCARAQEERLGVVLSLNHSLLMFSPLMFRSGFLPSLLLALAQQSG